jgi:hypothetical protein
MDFKVELYRGLERIFFGTVPFMPLLRQSLTTLLGSPVQNQTMQVIILNVPEETSISSGVPLVENLMTDFGYAYIKVFQGDYLIYQHPHPISDIITLTLQKYLREIYPDEPLWGFRLDVPGMPALSARKETPRVEGSMIVSNQSRNFNIRRLELQTPPSRSLLYYGIEALNVKSQAKVKVVLSEKIQIALLSTHPFSWEVEEGGFLVGYVYSDSDVENGYIVEIADMPVAQHTGASLLHFTFTGDSFAEVKRMLRSDDRPLRIVGWYHTHLFPATETFGLSSIDVKLHFTTFTTDWQVAGLVNLDTKMKRTLRFYVAHNDEMILCPHWTINEHIKNSSQYT